jgi:hypothetical protein
MGRSVTTPIPPRVIRHAVLTSLLGLATACVPEATGLSVVGGRRDAGSDAAAVPDVPSPDRPTSPGQPLTLSQELSFPETEILELRYRADGMLLACTARQGVRVLDARDPGGVRPLPATRTTFGDFDYFRCSHIAVGSSLAFATFRADVTQPSSLTAIELSDPPAVVAAYRAPAGVTFDGVVAVGDRQFVAMRRDGLGVFTRAGDTFTPGPVLRGLTDVTGLALDGSVLCVADGEGGLATVDARDPDALRVLGRVATGGIAQTVAVDTVRHLAFVSAGSAGVVVVDVARPEAPALVGRVPTSGVVGQIEVVDGRLYVATWRDVRAYDLSVPSRPLLFGVVHPSSPGQNARVEGVAVRGDVLAVANWNFLDTYRLLPDRAAPYLVGQTEQIGLGRVAVGASASAFVTVENLGRAPLSGVSARVGDPAFSVTPETLSLDAGESAELRVDFRPVSSAPATTTLSLSSADPLANELRIELRANVASVAVGDPAPEESAQLTDGTAWSLQGQRGNVVMLVYFTTW